MMQGTLCTWAAYAPRALSACLRVCVSACLTSTWAGLLPGRRPGSRNDVRPQRSTETTGREIILMRATPLATAP